MPQRHVLSRVQVVWGEQEQATWVGELGLFCCFALEDRCLLKCHCCVGAVPSELLRGGAHSSLMS